jgi:hypothetical protein
MIGAATAAAQQAASFGFYWNCSMIGLIARWSHNVLITTMAFLTLAMVVFLTR